jgi:hypothetical protein
MRYLILPSICSVFTCPTWPHSVSLTKSRVWGIVLTIVIAEAGHKPGESIICTGKIKHKGSTYTDQWNYLKNLLPADRVGGAKLTLPAPEWYHLRYQSGKAYPKDVYANDEEYFADIAIAYQTELQILYDAGCRNVTIDDPNLACKLGSNDSVWHPRN